jgi:cleavage and polyadenylation specificity factor subunit 2
MDGKLDEGSARLLLDSAPSKVISNEMTVSSYLYLLFSLCNSASILK